jgi:LPS-assembly protein
LFKNLELKFSTNYVSDFRYDRDFEDYSIYKDSNENSDDTKNEYINEIRLNYKTKYADFAVRYRDDMEYNDLEGGYEQTRIIRYPNVIVEKNNVNLSFFKINYKADYNNIKEAKKIFHFESSNTKTEYTHQRLQAKLDIYKSINLKIGTFTPSYTQYATHWFDMDDNIDLEDKSLSNDLSLINESDDTVDRLIYHVNMEFNLNEIYKQYKWFKHSIYNSYSFSYIPYLDQGNIPDLIEDDIIEEERLHKFTSINYLKSKDVDAKFEFIQEYDDALHKDKFNPFYVKMNLKYTDYFNFLFNYKYDYYLKDSPYLKNNIKFKFENYYAGYEFVYDEEIEDDENNNIKVFAGGKILKIRFEISETASRTSENLSVSDFDKYKSKTFESKITYDADCWSFGVKFKQKDYLNVTDTGNNRKIENIYYIYAELKGIGKTDREVYKN